MNNYIPFLKLKSNEIGALKELASDIKQDGIVPFFDLAKKEDMTSLSFQEMVNKSVISLSKNIKEIDRFFLDNFDIDDRIIVNNQNNYGFVIEAFSELNFIPVIGLDRAVGRNQLVFDHKKNGTIKSDAIAIRLVLEDFENFELVSEELEDLVNLGQELFNEWILILDNRVCLDIDVSKRIQVLVDFLVDSAEIFDFDRVIIAGSSLSPSIRDILEVGENITHDRIELNIYSGVTKELNQLNLYLGDYTIISPLYSDVNLPGNMMQNVMTAKIIYTHGRNHYIERGYGIKAKGNSQYNEIARDLVTRNFYRGASYSFGDNFLHEKANYIGSNVTPSTILKPTINTHITYMIRDFVG
jgi:hypothetical protein